MKHYRLILAAGALLLAHLSLTAQTVWHDPAKAGFPVIQGQGWTEKARENPYTRFPDSVQPLVRPIIWRLSKNSAGESIRFSSSSKQITVRYTVAERLAMSHMPATGVSGVDLYTKNRHGDEIWIGGKYAFADTVTYKFGSLDFGGEEGPHTYTLFLPLYNTVTWMEIGVDEGADFRFEPKDAEAPIVAYGTSIGQGACASRPGMAWSNILQRRLDRPVMNLGFSGSAYFEGEVVELLGQTDSKAIILDALPNSHIMPHDKLRDTIMASVRHLRRMRPKTPILLADHLGYPHSRAIDYYAGEQKHANETQKEAFDLLIEEGVEHLYHLSCEEIALPQDGTVEGIHVSDLGMAAYADAYEKKLREILAEPQGESPATRPVTQSRDVYDWNARHRALLTQTRGKHYPTVIIGNSIIHQWGGAADSPVQRGQEVWNEQLSGALNMGCGWDKVENVLWRIYHDELDHLTADRIILAVGTDNLSSDTDAQIVEGIRLLIEAVALRRPEAELRLIGILPCAGMEKRIAGLNRLLARLASEMKVEFADPGRKMLGKGGKIDESLFVDGQHPSEEGYRRIVSAFVR